MKKMKVDAYPCDGEGNRMAGFGSTPEQPIFVPVISPLAPKQDIFREASSPMPSGRPFPIDVEGVDYPAPAPTFEQEVDTQLAQIRELLLTKNRKYGDSALNPLRVFSKASAIEQILVRIDDKLSRIRTGTKDREDTKRDLIGYLVLLLIAEES